MSSEHVSIVWNSDIRASEVRVVSRVARPLDVTFSFFSDAFNLESITPPWLNFKVTTPAPIRIQRGMLIDYRLRLHGIPFRWRTEITSWDPPYSFTDRQLFGPFRMWEHLHTFREENGETVVEDLVRYRVPLGRIVNKLFVQRDVQRIFEYRHAAFPQVLEQSLRGQPSRELAAAS